LPDCIPTVWRPSTFSCYDTRQQALIILGAFASCVTSLWGGFVLYKQYNIGHQRLTRRGVDLTRLARPARVLAKALIADKCIRLHKLQEPITYSTLCNSLPFDEEQDRDMGDRICSTILKLASELEKHGTPLDLKHMVDAIRLSQVSHQQPDDTQTGVAQLRRRQSSAVGGGAHNSSAGTPNGPGTSSVRPDPSRPPQAVVISHDVNDTALASSRSNLAAEPPNSPSSATPLNEVVIQPQRDRSQPPPAGSRSEPSRPPPQPPSGERHPTDTSGVPLVQAHSSGKGTDIISTSKASGAVTSPPPSVKTGSIFASLGWSRLPASQLQECDAALELDVISSSPHPLDQAVVGAEASWASASAQLPQVRSLQSQHVSPRAIQPRSIHRSSAPDDAASVSPDDSTTATQPLLH
jgi:hypothetical protein